MNFGVCVFNQVPSHVSINDVYFKEINGTLVLQVGATQNCSSGTPCQNIHLVIKKIFFSNVSARSWLLLSAQMPIYITQILCSLLCNYILQNMRLKAGARQQPKGIGLNMFNVCNFKSVVDNLNNNIVPVWVCKSLKHVCSFKTRRCRNWKYFSSR